MAHDDGSPVRLSEYCSLLVGNRRFRYMFSSYLLTNMGKWVNYIASLALIHQLVDQPDAAASTHSARPAAASSGSGWLTDEPATGNAHAPASTPAQQRQAMFVAGYMFLRMMPALVLAPIIGCVADRCDKRLTMAGCDTLAGVSAALLTLLSVSSGAAYNTPSEHSHYRVCLAFFLLTFCQQSFTAQYTSLRKSLVPQVCLGRELKLATTVDASVWSAVMCFGGALGGLLTQEFGITANFAVDTLTYALSAALILLMGPMKRPVAAGHTSAPASSVSKGAEAADGPVNDGSATNQQQQQQQQQQQRPSYTATAGAALCDRCCFSETVVRLSRPAEAEDATLAPLWPFLCAYPSLLIMLLAKMSGALTWGIAELLEVQLANDLAFQLQGSSPSATLGLTYAAGGVGALLGPLVANSFAATAKASEARSTLTMVVGFGIGVVAYAALFLAVVEDAHPNKGHLGNGGRVASLAASAFLRSISSSLIWVFSTLVVQIKILGPQGGNPWENPIFGRVFALEMSVFTAGKLGSFVLGGAGIGLFSCGHECACQILLAISVTTTAFWSGVFALSTTTACSVQRRQHAPAHDLLEPLL